MRLTSGWRLTASLVSLLVLVGACVEQVPGDDSVVEPNGGGADLVESMAIVSSGGTETLAFSLTEDSGLDWLDVQIVAGGTATVFTAGFEDETIRASIADGRAWIQDAAGHVLLEGDLTTPQDIRVVPASFARGVGTLENSGSNGEFIVDRPINIHASTTLDVSVQRDSVTIDPFDELVDYVPLVEECDPTEESSVQSFLVRCTVLGDQIEITTTLEIPPSDEARQQLVGIFVSEERCRDWNDLLTTASSFNNWLALAASAAIRDARASFGIAALAAVVSEITNRTSVPCAQIEVADELVAEWTETNQDFTVDVAVTGAAVGADFSSAAAAVRPFSGTASGQVALTVTLDAPNDDTDASRTVSYLGELTVFDSGEETIFANDVALDVSSEAVVGDITYHSNEVDVTRPACGWLFVPVTEGDLVATGDETWSGLVTYEVAVDFVEGCPNGRVPTDSETGEANLTVKVEGSTLTGTLEGFGSILATLTDG